MDRFVLAAFPTVGLNPLTLRGFLGLRAKPKLHVLDLSPSALSYCYSAFQRQYSHNAWKFSRTLSSFPYRGSVIQKEQCI
ncbi:hypothetical protein BDQ94DRAFT_143026 [Aspergillus welwitschiae]|uniref:Uncharacterized protein n=1 Tax=Aspergillus welwitschiae TaxID=1341132 RepID=A0A3F3Q449_9EURO|nr:hypothetical protein BDQ94DRAFT_143026 [Aspergillus welwitschiae]RDH33979.1 hypothetical protein BDQ94DRAFT_143026 [Aspergillus welwitschiae]